MSKKKRKRKVQSRHKKAWMRHKRKVCTDSLHCLIRLIRDLEIAVDYKSPFKTKGIKGVDGDKTRDFVERFLR